MLTLYGIRNCDTCREARRWLDERGIAYRFHDLRADGIDRPTIEAWAGRVGTAALVNRRGRTWKQLDGAWREQADDSTLHRLAAEEPTLLTGC